MVLLGGTSDFLGVFRPWLDKLGWGGWVAQAAAIVMLLYAIFVLVAGAFQGPTPRAWARLNTAVAGAYRFRLQRTGTVESDSIADSLKERVPRDYPGTSMALSPDARVLAAMTNGHLTLSAVDPWSGRVFPWKGTIRLRTGKPEDVRVIAVAARGHQDAWVVLSKPAGPTWCASFEELNTGDMAEYECSSEGVSYAAVHQSLLLLVGGEGRKRIQEVGVARRAELRRDPRPWKHDFSWAEVRALDLATCDGRSYLAVLLAPDAWNARAGLIIMCLDECGTSQSLAVDPLAEHVSIVRGSGGNRQPICVLSGSVNSMRAFYPRAPLSPTTIA
jgi:hypothetical protein